MARNFSVSIMLPDLCFFSTLLPKFHYRAGFYYLKGPSKSPLNALIESLLLVEISSYFHSSTSCHLCFEPSWNSLEASDRGNSQSLIPAHVMNHSHNDHQVEILSFKKRRGRVLLIEQYLQFYLLFFQFLILW